MRSVLMISLAACLAAPAWASCKIQTGKCLTLPETAYTAPFAIGEKLPPGSFEVLLNVTYHGLPPSDGSFWYARSGRHVYKVTPGTYIVLDDVTGKARRLTR